MANENPAADDAPAPDPFEAELVAYLDGELDPAAARKVEAQLAKDPAARARAAELKKSFDMLDYLPRPEPSPTFTTRTLDKLPTVKPGASGTSPAARDGNPTPQPPLPTAAARPNTSRSGQAGPNVSTSMPIPLDADELPAPRPASPRRFLWAAAMVAAVSLFATLGYLATAAVRPHLFPTRDRDADEAKGEVEPRVIENLPLYAMADDLAFVIELARSDLFGEDPAVAYDSTLKIPSTDTTDKPTGKQIEALTKSFRALPPGRQAEIVKLDHELHTKEPRERERLFRVLEAYTVWLERLPEAERRGVLTAATPGLRIDVIRKIRDQQWRDSLPPVLRGNPELIQQWKDEEAHRRDRWAFIRQHAEAFAANKSPWPFDTEAGKASVIEYARDVFKVDDPKRCRLAPDELGEYRRTLAVAQRDGAWAWYGLLVYELANHHPYLPEPTDPKFMLTDVNDMPEPIARMFKKGMSQRLKVVSGKWPEFPLQLHTELSANKFGFVPPLGPAKLDDFKPGVRTFAEKELFPKMTVDEKRELGRSIGKWPEYPQRFLQYAHKYDLPVPGITLPGSPKKWDTTYGMRTGTRPNKERERD